MASKKSICAEKIIKILLEEQPEARCTLNFVTDWQLLFAAILASQCTDERVNIITERMFREWPDLTYYRDATLAEVEEMVRTCGLYRMKAKSIKGSAEILLNEYEGQVPSEHKQLLALPGVGQKIANLLQGELFAKPAMVVDTHCGRIARLLGLSKAKTAKGVEKDLCKYVPQEYWVVWGHHMVELGRTVCQARCRKCLSCPVREHCAYAEKNADLLAENALKGELDACC